MRHCYHLYKTRTSRSHADVKSVRVSEHPTFPCLSIIFSVYVQQSLSSIMCPNKRHIYSIIYLAIIYTCWFYMELTSNWL